MRCYVSPANAMTSVGLAAGFGALLLAAEGRLGWAAAAIAVAAVLDLLDGPVARRSAKADRFGAELDSLTDLVAFGVAPAILVYEAAAGAPRVLAAAGSLVFVLAGAWRLARFPLLQCTDRFAGLPTPPSGLVLALASLALPAGGVLVLALALALLMVSTAPFPTLGGALRLVGIGRPASAEPAGAVGPAAAPAAAAGATATPVGPAVAGVPAPAVAAVASGLPDADLPARKRRVRRRPSLRVRVPRARMVRAARRARRRERDALLAAADRPD